MVTMAVIGPSSGRGLAGRWAFEVWKSQRNPV